jgi:glycosyltransferase involved in cell wall biosynthesis
MLINDPLVSIVIPVYNGANYLQEAINSALAQTYRNIEVVVVNDGSDDEGETEHIALSYGDRIRYFSKENGGVATALNLGIERMSGDYFSWLSHDDMYTPDKIAKQVAAIQQFGQPAIAYCDYCHLLPSGKLLETYRVSPKGEKQTRALLALGHEPGIHGCSLLIPSQLFDQYGLFNPELRYTQDVDMWFRMAGNVPFIHVKEVLVRSRNHEEQDSQKKKLAFYKECDLTLNRLISRLSFEEIALYCDHSFDSLIAKYSGYRSVGFVKTSYRLLKSICLLANNSINLQRAADIIEDTVGLSGSPKEMKLYLNLEIRSLLSSPRHQPRMLIYCGPWVRGGAQRVFATIVEALADKFECVIISSNILEQDGFPLPQGITHIQLNPMPMETIASRLTALSALLEADLFVGSPTYDCHFLSIFEMLNGLGIKSVACNLGHYFLPYAIDGLQPVIESRIEAFQHASAVTWLTSYSAHVYAQLQDNSVLLPTPNTFPKSPQKAPKDKKVILAVGRFNDPIKRLDRILEVFARVLRQHPDAELVLVGPYNLELRADSQSQETIADVLARLAIPKSNLQFVGEQKKVKSYYMKASLLLLTSESEGIPMVLNEAGTFGLPCVINQISGLEDMIADGENGFIVPQGDLDAIADKVNLLLSDAKLRAAMGDRAYERIDRFSQQQISGRWTRLIELLLATTSKAELNAKLSADFMEPITDLERFSKQVVKDYENSIVEAFKIKRLSMPAQPVLPVPVPIQNTESDHSVLLINNITGPSEDAVAIAYERVMQDVMNTVSWKVTKPLRWFRRKYDKVKNRRFKSE